MDTRSEKNPDERICRLLIEAFEHDDEKAMMQLIESHPFINNEFKMPPATPLIVFAADHGSENILQLLIKKEFDVKATSSDDRNALISCSLLNPYFPRCEQRVRMASLLLSMGLDVNSATSMGATPLHMAALGNLTKLAQLLIERGARINQVDQVQRTPLELICDQETATEEIVGTLVDAGSTIPSDYQTKVYDHYVSNALYSVGLFKDAHRIIKDYVNIEVIDQLDRCMLKNGR